MPRKLLIRSQEFPYHVTARGNNRDQFPCDLEVVWSIFSALFVKIIETYQVKIHAFVLMPNHFHLLISTPHEDLGVVMQELMRSVTRIINSRSGRSGRIFGSKYHWTIITNDLYYDCALKYLYRNPVKAKLAVRVEDYFYSTLTATLGDSKPDFLLAPALGHNDLFPAQRKQAFLFWLNHQFHQDQEKQIQRALKKTHFVPSKIGSNRKLFQLSGFK